MNHDLYHLPDYVALCARHEGATPKAYLVEVDDQFLFVPLLVRRLPPELGLPSQWRDARSPYGYTVPLTNPHGSSAALRECHARFLSDGREEGLISAFVGGHPVLPDPTSEFSGDTTRVKAEVVVVNVRREVSDYTRPSTVYDVTRLRRDGFRAIIDDWTRYDEFIAEYHATMRRKGAAPFYHFSQEYFHELRETKGCSFHLCIVEAPDGAFAAGGLFSSTDGLLQYLFSAQAPRDAPRSPSKLMLYHMRHWAFAHGHDAFILGGGKGGETDSLSHFKQGFTRETLPYHNNHIVFDEARYEAAVTAWTDMAGAGAPTHFFPPYRAALPRVAARR